MKSETKTRLKVFGQYVLWCMFTGNSIMIAWRNLQKTKALYDDMDRRGKVSSVSDFGRRRRSPIGVRPPFGQ